MTLAESCSTDQQKQALKALQEELAEAKADREALLKECLGKVNILG